MTLVHRICPSILAADFMEMGAAIDELAAVGCDYLHMDVMDGHFVPDITFGSRLLADARRRFNGLIDSHLMVTDPAVQFPLLAAAGADLLTFHLEVAENPVELIHQIHDLGKKAGIAIDGPTHNIAAVEPLLPDLEVVLIATGKVGKAGQAIDLSCLDKVRAVRRMRGGAAVNIMVDIGINSQTINAARDAGANWFVASSAIFGVPAGIGAAFAELKSMIS